MSNALQKDYEKLLQDLDSAKSDLVRAETNLEQKKKELTQAQAQLKELTNTSDVDKINALIKEIDARLLELITEAQTLFDAVGN